MVAAYKESPFLEGCLRSLLNQTERCQVLISTSTPTPYIFSVAGFFQIPVVINPSGGTISRDWNFALQQGDHSIVVIAHQDDVYEPNFAERVLSAWQSTPQLLMSFTDHAELLVDSPRPDGLNLKVKRWLIDQAFGEQSTKAGPSIRRKLLRWGNPISCPSVALNRQALPNFQFSDEWEINLDWEAWDRICRHPGSLAYIRERLVHHRVHPSSETSAGIHDRRRCSEDLRMFQRFWPNWIASLLMLPYRISYLSNRFEPPA